MHIICHGLKNSDESIFQINDHGIFIGNDERNEIVLSASGISGRHVHLFVRDMNLMLEDSGSLNGTFLNGQRIMKEIRVVSGVRVQIGLRQIRFESVVSDSSDVSWHVFIEEPETSVFQQEDNTFPEPSSVSALAGNNDNAPSSSCGNDESSIENADEFATAMTVMADANIKEMIRAGKFEELEHFGETNTNINLTTSSRVMLSEGKVIGKYKIVRKIGKGGMGVIYLARHETLNAYRALKVLPREINDDNDQFFERFLREARMASEIHHPNVVGVMDVETDTDYGVSYIVMEYIDGGSLRHVLKSQKKLTEEQAVVIVQGVAEALSAAAEHKIVHRDIKPDNIMFTKRGEVKLADLGIAKNDNDDVNLTKTNIMIGTPAYLSPEQVENPKSVDIRSDIYSLGATFYEMLTGQHPYVGSTTYDIIHKLFSDPVPDPRDKNPEISAGIAKIVMKMLAKEPDKRYQTPAELLAAVTEDIPQYSVSDAQALVKSAISGNSPENLSSTLFTSSITRKKLKLKTRRKRILWGFLAAVTVCFVIGFGIYAFYQQPDVSTRVLPHVRPSQPVRSVVVAPSPQPSGKKLFTLRLKTEPGAEIQIISASGIMTTYMIPASGTVYVKELVPGSYMIKAQCRGRKNYDSEISISEDRELAIQLQIDSKSATFATLPGATLSIEGKSGLKKSASVPISGIVKFPELPLDSYTVNITRDGYQTEKRTFSLNDDIAMQIPLTELQASLHISTIPSAEIELAQSGIVKYSQKAGRDGILHLSKFRKGDYTLKISHVNFQTKECRIELHDDLSLDLPLNPVVRNLTIYAPAYTLVRLQRENTIVKEAHTNIEGKLVMSSMPVGKYEAFFSRDGFHPASQNITLTDDLSVRIAMKRLPEGKTTEPDMKNIGVQTHTMYGFVVIGINASRELLAYVMKNGLEIRIEDGEWEKVEKFPYKRKISVGKNEVRIRGNGIQPLPPEQVFIKQDECAEMFFVLLPMPAKVIFSSNDPHAKFFFLNSVYPVGASATIDPFKQYPLTVKVDGFEPTEKIVLADAPGMTTRCHVIFEQKSNPFLAEFNQGMELLKKQKYEDALKILTIAGDGGHPEAARQVAIIYEKGLGMWFSKKSLALEWYRKAARNGDIPCAFLVAEAIRNGDINATEKEMFSFYLQAADGRHPQAAYQVAKFYEKGTGFLSADEQKNIQFLTLAAELQYPPAMFELGLRYENGKGVPLSTENAIDWYRKAAAAGFEKAQKRLSVLKKMEP